MVAEFVFVCDDTSKPPLAPLYRGLYRVLRLSEMYFVLQFGDKSDSVSVKPVISSTPVTPEVPIPRGHPWLVPASIPLLLDPTRLLKKKVFFSVPVPAMKLHKNPQQTV